MFEFAKTFIYYPVAASFHALQGIIIGWLGVRAIISREISDSLTALVILVAFLAYEITEQWKINDSAYLDIEFMWTSAMITGVIYGAIHLWRTKCKKNF